MANESKTNYSSLSTSAHFPLIPPPPFNPQSAFFPPQPPLPSNVANTLGFLSPPFPPAPTPSSFPLPPPSELLSKLIQTPPPPLPVPAPVNTTSTKVVPNVNHEDLYDPLQAEDDDDDEHKQAIVEKPAARTFNVKKEITIKIEPRSSSSPLEVTASYSLSLSLV